VAGWKTREVDLEAETLVFERPGNGPDGDAAASRRRTFSVDEILPPHDPGPWPAGLTLNREQLYDEDGR